MTNNLTIDRIRTLRKKYKYSQHVMADKLHIALKTYQNIENGNTKIDLARLQEIAQVLQTDIRYLLQEDTSLIHKTTAMSSEEKQLYKQIIKEKEYYIEQLEESLRFYREIIRENNML